jgi:HEAT repeat protein
VTIHARVVLGAALFAIGSLGASTAAWGAARRARASAHVPGESAAPRPTRSRLSADELDKLRNVLAGTDQTAVIAATKALGDSSAANASVPLVEMLAVGAAPAGTLAAIDALRRLRDPSSIEVLVLYAGNRGPDIRRHAVEALGAFPDARVVPTLLERLGDAAPDVRGAAAEALATRGDKSSAPRLLALLKRNDPGAAAPLGTVAPVSLLPEIAELQGSIDDANLATALGELLKRQDVAEPVRIDIIKTLGRVPGAAATTALIEYVGTLASNDGRPSKAEAQKLIDERGKQK